MLNQFIIKLFLLKDIRNICNSKSFFGEIIKNEDILQILIIIFMVKIPEILKINYYFDFYT